jgi:hypothetical protein
MTGILDRNYPAFTNASTQLRLLGHLVYNPASWEFVPVIRKFNLFDAFSDYCMYIINVADAVVVLPNWEKSLGATAETALAKAIGKPVLLIESFLTLSKEE